MGSDETEGRRVDGDIDDKSGAASPDVEGQGRKFYRDPEERAATADEEPDVEGQGRRFYSDPEERAARAGDKDDEGQGRR